MSAAKLAAILAASCLLAACTGNYDLGHRSEESTGLLPGGFADASVNPQTGEGAGGQLTNAAIGAAIDNLIGNRIGAALDDEDKRRAYAAQMDALNHGPSDVPVSWRNPDSGRYGTVVPGPYYEKNGRRCRSYTHTVYIDTRPQTVRRAACRNADGSWSPLD